MVTVLSFAIQRLTRTSLALQAPKIQPRTSRGMSSDAIRVLALHGSEGRGDSFIKTLDPWNKAWNWDLRAIDAPVEKGKGLAWWAMPPYVRSFNATQYEHYETSEGAVLKELRSFDPHLVIGHSQGAILITAMLARNKINQHPKFGYILNGGAWPNPYSEEFRALQLSGSPEVLVIAGDNDRVTPNEQSLFVADALSKAGAVVTQVRHPGGHSVPITDDEAFDAVQAWLFKRQ